MILYKKIQMVLTFSENFTLQEAFETVAQMNEELKRAEYDGPFCKKFKPLAKRRKSFEEMFHQKKNRGHRTSKIVTSRKSHSNGHLPYHYSFVI